MSVVNELSSSFKWYAKVVNGDIVEYSGKPFNSPVNVTPVIASVPPVTVISPDGVDGKVNIPKALVVAEPTLLVTVAPDRGPSDAFPLNPVPLPPGPLGW